jgi:hypothetical protein
MISRCSDARDRSKNRNEWRSETTTDATTGGYPRTTVTLNQLKAYHVYGRHNSMIGSWGLICLESAAV